MSSSWDASVPFRRFNPVMNVFSAMPTLPLVEFTFHWLLGVCAMHAHDTGHHWELGSALATGIVTKALFERTREATKFPTPATVMLSPRLALYSVEATAVSLYVSLVAAKRANVGGGLRQAALTGILACLLQASAEANGTRFVWWTWHDSAPSVRQRVLGVPVSASLQQLAQGAVFGLLCEWLGGQGKPATEALAGVLPLLPEQNRAFASFVLQVGHACGD